MELHTIGHRQSTLLLETTIGENENIALLRLNRPKFGNAYNEELLAALDARLQALSAESKCAAIIITAQGTRAFCGGADLNELRGRRAFDGLDLASRAVFDRLASLPIPTLAAINGAAVGGGLELALACDIRLCTDTATFSLPELTMAISPAAGGMRRLPTVIGSSRAKEVILFGRVLSAAQALEWGLVNYVGQDFEAKALEMAEHAARQDRLANRLSKCVINDSAHFSTDANLESVVQALLYETKHQRGRQ